VDRTIRAGEMFFNRRLTKQAADLVRQIRSDLIEIFTFLEISPIEQLAVDEQIYDAFKGQPRQETGAMTRARKRASSYQISQSPNLVSIKCSDRTLFIDVDVLKHSKYFSFQINAREQFGNNLTFDFTAHHSRIVNILLNALHFDEDAFMPIPQKNKNIVNLLELIIFLLDDGKLNFESKIEENMLEAAISYAIPYGLNDTELCFVFVFLSKLSEVHDVIKSPTSKLISKYKTSWFDKTILNFVKEGNTANAVDNSLRGEAFWVEIMGTSSKTGNWNDWFTKENYEKVYKFLKNNDDSIRFIINRCCM